MIGTRRHTSTRGRWRHERAGIPLQLFAALVLVASGCGRGGGASPSTAAQARPTTVGQENIAVVDSGEVRSGPILSGSLEAEQRASVRAQVAGQVMQTYVDQGDSVHRGQLLARIDDTALREAALSAQSAVRSAQAALTNAQRDQARNERLYKAGAIAERDLQASQLTVSTAKSALADAQSRQALAQQQLDKTTVQAPFAGVVSTRSVNAGDAVQVGAALFTIVNPSSMRLEASVPAAQLSALRVGEAVRFSVTGYPDRTFTGHISRISPTADSATRQVRIYATIPNKGRALVGGLYAQGTVASESQRGLLAPASAIDESGLNPTVVRIEQGKAQRVEVQVGLRDPQTNQVALTAGVAMGDTLLLGAARGITPGTSVRVVVTADEAASQR
ncbi:MAG TPA: efflux RND transporter periplasmic adaptor subunit [Gemmatimonadaceae bacterium]|nr:efflux RND transporter periplasmic adaptor subunit [Gemmatimonadaceae bacterium]